MELAKCRISLPDYLKALYKEKGLPAAYKAYAQSGPFASDLACLLELIGALEPLGAHRTPAGDVREVWDKTIDVPPATVDSTGKVIPSDGKLIRVCAPEGKVLVADKMRVLPDNLTAEQFGEVIAKKQAVFGFSEGFCLSGEPGDGDDLGTFSNVEHIVMCPKSGFDLYGRNHNQFSIAAFRIHAELWTAC